MASFEKIKWQNCLKPHFAKIVPNSDTFVENVKNDVINGRVELWTINDVAWFTCYVSDNMAGEKVLYIKDICGQFPRYFEELSVFVSALAKRYDCIKVSVTTERKALLKIYQNHNFKVCDYVLERYV